MKPKLSIIVPVYNVERYLNRCIESIVNQSYKDFELILVNDGSIDNSGRICDEYSLKYKFIKVIHKPNEGLGFARNAGINESKGDFLGFIDSDDWVSTKMYEIMMTYAINKQADIVSCKYKKVYDEEDAIQYNTTQHITTHYKTTHYNNIDSIVALYRNDNLDWIVCNKIYRRELFIKVNFEKVSILEDVLIMPQLFYQTNRVIHIEEHLYYYYQRQGSIVNSELTFKKFENSMIVFNKLIIFFKERENVKLIKLAESMLCSSLVNWKIRLERKGLCSKEFNKEIRKNLLTKITSFLRNEHISFKMRILVFFSFFNLGFISVYGKLKRNI